MSNVPVYCYFFKSVDRMTRTGIYGSTRRLACSRIIVSLPCLENYQLGNDRLFKTLILGLIDCTEK